MIITLSFKINKKDDNRQVSSFKMMTSYHKPLAPAGLKSISGGVLEVLELPFCNCNSWMKFILAAVIALSAEPVGEAAAAVFAFDDIPSCSTLLSLSSHCCCCCCSPLLINEHMPSTVGFRKNSCIVITTLN